MDLKLSAVAIHPPGAVVPDGTTVETKDEGTDK
jgi:hypothetical protein